MKKIALLTGVTGQDGSYLSELLLEKGYKVYGMKRRSSVDTTERINHLIDNPNFELFENDVADATGIFSTINNIKPDECYNLAAMSHVHTSFEQPVVTFEINAIGVLNLLEAIRQCSPKTRFYQASTSELFGNATQIPQNENTSFMPRSPYSVAKLAAHNLVRLYREAYGIFACAGILFNHESPRRGENFVTRKITLYIAKLAKEIQKRGYRNEFDYLKAIKHIGPLSMGNMDAKRDWGFAGDYVCAMYKMLQLDKPDDFVIATGKTHTVQEFIDHAAAIIGVPSELFVVRDHKLIRPAEVNMLCGDASKAKSILGWEPSMTFKELVWTMVVSDMKALDIDF